MKNETAKTDIPAWKPKIAFDKSRPAVSGVWVLIAKLSGVSGKKNYKNQKYIFPYNGKTHVAPQKTIPWADNSSPEKRFDQTITTSSQNP